MKPETIHTVYFMSVALIMTTIVFALYFERGVIVLIRNIVISNMLLLAAYLLWLRAYNSYRKIYRLSLK